MQFATGFTVTREQENVFQKSLMNGNFGALKIAREQAYLAYEDYRQSRGWFFSCDDNCQQLYLESQKAEKILKQREEEYSKALSEARASVGVFSEYAVTDARESFWDAYSRGVGFAKRMSYYDALYFSISSMRSDESLMSVILNWLFSAIMNFVVGMMSALISFMFHVIGLIFSYQADPIRGTSFFILAFCGGFAIIASFVVGAYFVAASSFFVISKMFNLRIEVGTRDSRRIRFE